MRPCRLCVDYVQRHFYYTICHKFLLYNLSTEEEMGADHVKTCVCGTWRPCYPTHENEDKCVSLFSVSKCFGLITSLLCDRKAHLLHGSEAVARLYDWCALYGRAYYIY